MSSDILVIPDAHAHPDYDNTRFDWLGNFIVDRRPDIILCLGDLADMPSLSSYDKGTKGFEGRRYRKDIEVTIDAQERLFGPTAKLNRSLKKRRKAQYSPERILTLGNHEDRIDRVINSTPELDGTISIIDDLRLAEHWDKIVPFKDKVVVEGILASHYFVSGVAGRPTGGTNPAYTILSKNYMSSIAGHSHTYDMCWKTRGDGTKLFGLVAGCYSHPDQVEGWNRATAPVWYYGITYLGNVKDGAPETVESISMKALEEKYG